MQAPAIRGRPLSARKLDGAMLEEWIKKEATVNSSGSKEYSAFVCYIANLYDPGIRDDCECRWISPCGWVPEAGCPTHDRCNLRGSDERQEDEMTLDEWREKKITAEPARRTSGADDLAAAERAVVEAALEWREKDFSHSWWMPGKFRKAVSDVRRLRAARTAKTG